MRTNFKRINIFPTLGTGVLFFAIICSLFSPAIARATIYQPGETLEPDCAPGSANCGVAILTINNQSGASQTLVAGTSGTDFTIVSGSNVHTLNFPDASALNRGLLTALDFATFNLKQSALGYVPLNPANNLSDLPSVSTARTNLGLGSLATQSGTVSGTNTGDQDLSGLLVKANNLSDVASTGTARTNLGLGSLATLSSINNSNWSGTGLSNANLANSSISFATGTSGTDLNVSGSPVSLGGTVTLNIPDASALNRGLVTASDWSVFNAKQSALGYVPLNPSNNLSDLASASTARTNLGLGTLATQSGTVSGTNTGDQVISDSTISLTDITTNNVSTTQHGFVPKAPNSLTSFLRGDGSWATITAGVGDVVGPLLAADNRVAFFDGVTGKLIKDSGLTLSGTNTGDQTSVSGNAGTATALQTARTINGVSFDGTANITVADATKVVANSAITGATKTKLTYDSKGLVTAGADATTADIASSTNKNYVTDAALTVLGNTSGTNTGDQDLSTLLVKASNLSDLASAGTARTNLGLGTLATQSGTFSGTSSGANTGDQTTITGNAGTATVLATNGANCSAGLAPLGVDASGAVESCTDFEEDLSNSAGLLVALSDETGTGFAVFATSPTLVTPALGTPSALVGTNITGTASGLTAGTVTTNANLTGAVTSTGNSTVLGSFTTATLNTALSDNDIATLAGTETLSAKTLTAPKIADLGYIADASGNESLIFDSVASAVNEFTLVNASAGNSVALKATGGDTDVALSLDAKGAGVINIGNTSTGSIVIAGGSGSSGCTITTSGALSCTGAGTFSNFSGTNTGDQASIVGITGTTAQFNTALTDGDFATGGGTATGTNTGDQTTITGNAGTSTALQTARTINGVSFDGTANITVAAAAGTLTGATLASGVTASSLTSLGIVSSGTWNGTTIAVANGGTGTTNGSITGTGALSFTSNTTNALTLDSGTTGAINLGTNANAKIITIGNGTGATSLVLNAGTGNIDIGANAVARTINIGTGAAVVETINLGGTGANVIGIGNTQTAGSVNIGAGMTTGTIRIGGTGAQTGTITIDGGTGAQTVSVGNGAGNKTVALGSTNTTSTLTLNSGSGGIFVNGLAAQTNGKRTVCIDNTTKQLFLGNSASTCDTSSVRYKHDIVDIGLGLEAVKALRPVSYAYNSNNAATLGFIAEEVAQIDERLVNRNADGVIDGINPDTFVPILTKAIQEQQRLLGDFSKAQGLSALVAATQSETPHDPVDSIAKKLGNSQRLLTNFVSARVTAIRGYFTEVFANKTHQKTLCVGSTGNETCITKHELDSLLSSLNSTPVPQTEATEPPADTPTPTAVPNETPIEITETPTPTIEATPLPEETPLVSEEPLLPAPETETSQNVSTEQ